MLLRTKKKKPVLIRRKLLIRVGRPNTSKEMLTCFSARKRTPDNIIIGLTDTSIRIASIPNGEWIFYAKKKTLKTLINRGVQVHDWRVSDFVAIDSNNLHVSRVKNVNVRVQKS